MNNGKGLKQLFSDFENECKYSSRLSGETVRGYSDLFHLFQNTMPEVDRVQFITTEMMVEFFKRLQTRNRRIGRNTWKIGVKATTIKTYWSKLNVFFGWLGRKGVLLENPLKNLQPPKVTYADSRALSDVDLKKIYAAISLSSVSTFAQRRDTAMVSLLIFTGLRLGEFVSLEVGDIDFDKQMLTVRSNTSKSKRVRHIPLHPTLQFHLSDYIAERNRAGRKTFHLWVSVVKDIGLSRHGLKHWCKTLEKKSGIRFHLHQFRHSFACNLALKDVSPIKIQRLLGHSSLDMTMTYLRSLGADNFQEDINKLSI